MSKIYGKQSGYLLKNDLKYYAISFLIFIIAVFILYLYLKGFSSLIKLGYLLIIIPILFVAVIRALEIIGVEFKKTSDKFYRGRWGEYDICDELKKLSDEYLIFRDVHLPNRNWNIDSVVIGPTGIYTIEVKSHKGRIGYDEEHQELILNEELFEKNILKQAMAQALSIKEYLNKRDNRNYFVKPMIVFSSPLR